MEAKLDIPLLIAMVGPNGARAALLRSERLTISDLQDLVLATGYPGRGRKATRDELVRILVAAHGKRIDKTLDELRGLSEEQLRAYFEESECSLDELSAFLDKAKLPYRRGLSRSELIRVAARQFSSLGVYQRIAGTDVSSETSATTTPSRRTDKQAPGEPIAATNANPKGHEASKESRVNHAHASEVPEKVIADETNSRDSNEKSESEPGPQLPLISRENRHR